MARSRSTTTSPAGTAFTFDIYIDPKTIARTMKSLDRWKGQPLKVRTDKATLGGVSLFVDPLKRRAARHVLTGQTRKDIAVRKLKLRKTAFAGEEIAAYKVGSDTWYRHFAIVGTPRNIPDYYVDEVKRALEGKVRSFIKSEIVRLA